MSNRDTTPDSDSWPNHALRVQVRPFGPSEETLREVARSVVEQATVRERLGHARSRLLSLDLLDGDTKGQRVAAAPRNYRATIYDYTHNRTLLVSGCLNSYEQVEVTESATQPLPSREEFEEAVELLARDERIGAELREQRLAPYNPMPPILAVEHPDGSSERVIVVGLHAPNQQGGHRIVGVNLVLQR